ncbi:hypothetical protein C0J52_17026 [Blattella germanica]|nr:hypothetical protein C0J52_17026 [Blattella germanica]
MRGSHSIRQDLIKSIRHQDQYNQSVPIGCLGKVKSSGRPRVSQETVKRVRASFQRSSQKSACRTNRALCIPQKGAYCHATHENCFILFKSGSSGAEWDAPILACYAYKAQLEKAQKAKSKESKAKKKSATPSGDRNQPRMSTKTTKDSECLYCKGLYSMSNEGCLNGHTTRALVQTVKMKTSFILTLMKKLEDTIEYVEMHQPLLRDIGSPRIQIDIRNSHLIESLLVVAIVLQHRLHSGRGYFDDGSLNLPIELFNSCLSHTDFFASGLFRRYSHHGEDGLREELILLCGQVLCFTVRCSNHRRLRVRLHKLNIFTTDTLLECESIVFELLGDCAKFAEAGICRRCRLWDLAVGLPLSCPQPRVQDLGEKPRCIVDITRAAPALPPVRAASTFDAKLLDRGVQHKTPPVPSCQPICNAEHPSRRCELLVRLSEINYVRKIREYTRFSPPTLNWKYVIYRNIKSRMFFRNRDERVTCGTGNHSVFKSVENDSINV